MEYIWDFPGQMEDYINGITRNGKARLRAQALGPLGPIFVDDRFPEGNDPRIVMGLILWIIVIIYIYIYTQL